MQNNLHEDPDGLIGKHLANCCMTLVNEVYGNCPEVKEFVFAAYKQNKIPDSPFTPEVWAWLEKATHNFQLINSEELNNEPINTSH